MKVSIALHTDVPDDNGNQRALEARYAGYNRGEGVMVIDADGNGICKIEALRFPSSQEDTAELFTHFSVGVCEGVDPGKGGAIIITGPLPEPLGPVNKGRAPVIVDQLVGVYAARIAEMRADGRMGPTD